MTKLTGTFRDFANAPKMPKKKKKKKTRTPLIDPGNKKTKKYN
jgi:hypothetical protein